jgi:hypothetical protein
MIERFAQIARPVLEWSMIRRIRRNHGLEHATVHILSGMVKGAHLAGRSSDSGFVILGDVPTDAVESAVREALHRMRSGEHRLAIHPNCGTNLVTAGGLTTLVALAGLRTSDDKSVIERLPMIMTLMMLAVLFSQPLGMSLQEHFTTEGDPGDLELVSVNRYTMSFPFGGHPVIVHSVTTHQG